MIRFVECSAEGITPHMLSGFHHHQVITKKWVSDGTEWKLIEASDLREWDEEKRLWIPRYLCLQMERGGSTVAAYDGDVLVGFCSVDGYLLGNTAKYANLTMLFVDDLWKRKGIGKGLFSGICRCAMKMKAEKLFISAIPSFETISFYFKMGCVDAKERIPQYVDTEYDRYLEYVLTER